GQLQLGPDGKIYMPNFQTSLPGYLSVIDNPDIQWATSPPTYAEYSYLKYIYASRKNGEGLPPVLKNLLTYVKIFYNNACVGQTTNFSFQSATTASGNPGSITWNFGDGSPLLQDVLNPSHAYASAGTYTVTLTVIDICGRSRSSTANVIVKSGPTVTHPASACGPTTVTFTGTGTNATNYIWSENAGMTPVLTTGNTYNYTGALPKTIYVKDPTPLLTTVVGNDTAYNHVAADVGETYFEIFTTITITSVTVRSRASGTNVSLQLQNQAGTTTYWTNTVSPAAAGISLPQTLNVTLGPGVYRFHTPAPATFWKNNLAPNDGGRDIAGVIDVTGVDYPNTTIKGGPFFNIGISIPDPCGVRAYTVTHNCPAPVELLTFNAQKSGSTALLKWSTAAEINNNHFLIQRSSDGLTFENIGKVKGEGDSKTIINYSFIDYHPENGRNFYRLVQVDHDGTSSNSEIVSLEFGLNSIKVIPNPFNEFTSIHFNSDDEWLVKVVDLSGKVCKEIIRETDQQTIKLGDDLQPGFYLIHLISESETATFKVLRE
ncbi:MAG: PKD domain-containing protein, partial [Cytophagaceae bacterium]